MEFTASRSPPIPAFQPSHYRPLEGGHNIRLLLLYPGSDEDSVRCELLHVSMGPKVHFYALSYVWGDPTPTKSVRCCFNERDSRCWTNLPVSTNLFEALKRIRDPKTARTWWIDAVCINQVDDQEKAHQISIMGQIYSRADAVHIWLGHIDCADDVVECIRSIHNFFTPEVQRFLRSAYADIQFADHCRHLRAKGMPTLLDVNITPLQKLLKLPWWRRKWVIQESVLAKLLFVVFGSVRLPFDTVTAAIERLSLVGIALVPRFTAQMEAEGTTDNFKELRLAEICARSINALRIPWAVPKKGPLYLLSVLSVAQHFNCSDPRDHIYAVLGLPWRRDVEDFDFMPDYTCDASTTLTRFAARFLRQSMQPLNLLLRTTDTRIPSDMHLPSWVPDWSRQQQILPLAHAPVNFELADGNSHLFQATKATQPVLKIDESRGILYIKGFKIDVVQATSVTWSDVDHQEKSFASTELPIDWIEEWKLVQWYQECVRVGNDSRVPLDADFHLAILCGIHYSQTGNVFRARAPKAHGTIFAEAMDLITRAVDAALQKHFSEARAYLDKARPTFALFQDALNSYSVPRTFFSTRGGNIGQAPPNVKPGDIVCLFLGGDTPFILRPIDNDSFTFVGHCYVRGIMDGEALGLGLPGEEFAIH